VLQKTKKILEWSIFSLLGIILLLSGSLLYYQQAYAGKIYKNVSVANIDLSGKTKQQAVFLLQKKFSTIYDQEITLKTEAKEVKTKVADTGLTLNADQIASDSYNIGRSNNFFREAYFSAQTLWRKDSIKVEPKIDQEKYKKFTEIAVAQLNTEPQDASILIENGEIKEKTEQEGQLVDAGNLTEKILALTKENSSKIISLEAKKTPPKVVVSSFGPAKAYAQTILSKTFKFTYDTSVFAPTKAEIGLWISFVNDKSEYKAVLNENNLQAYLNKIGKNFEVAKADRKINATNSSVIDEGRDGKYLDKNAAIAQIKSQLNSSNNIIVALATYAVARGEVRVFPAEGFGPGRFPGKYVDIDLTQQKLCEIDGNTILNCYIISSGKPGMATPAGTFTINDKNPRHWSGKYGMWLPWWQQFKTGGWGLHELPETDNPKWKEVPDHLGTPISHGCVRLGVGPAQELYNWTEMGTIVYIHK
jgi:vancomycin resistance protein YoaR